MLERLVAVQSRDRVGDHRGQIDDLERSRQLGRELHAVGSNQLPDRQVLQPRDRWTHEERVRGRDRHVGLAAGLEEALDRRLNGGTRCHHVVDDERRASAAVASDPNRPERAGARSWWKPARPSSKDSPVVVRAPHSRCHLSHFQQPSPVFRQPSQIHSTLRDYRMLSRPFLLVLQLRGEERMEAYHDTHE